MSQLPFTDPVLEVWPRIAERFAFYGKRLRAKPGPESVDYINKRLEDGFTPDELVAAVDGYVHCAGPNGLDTEWTRGPARNWFRIKTVFKLDGLEDRVERGLEGPWRRLKTVSRAEQRAAEHEQYMAEQRAIVERERAERGGGA